MSKDHILLYCVPKEQVNLPVDQRGINCQIMLIVDVLNGDFILDSSQQKLTFKCAECFIDGNQTSASYLDYLNVFFVPVGNGEKNVTVSVQNKNNIIALPVSMLATTCK